MFRRVDDVIGRHRINGHHRRRGIDQRHARNAGRVTSNIVHAGGDRGVTVSQRVNVGGGNGHAPGAVWLHDALIRLPVQRNGHRLPRLSVGGAGDGQILPAFGGVNDVIGGQWIDA